MTARKRAKRLKKKSNKMGGDKEKGEDRTSEVEMVEVVSSVVDVVKVRSKLPMISPEPILD